MNTYEYRILIGTDLLSKYFADPIEHAEADYIETYSGSVEADVEADVGHALFARHNRDNRPDGQLGPSLSIGDAIAYRLYGSNLAWRYITVEDVGFNHVDGLTVLDGTTWKDLFA